MKKHSCEGQTISRRQILLGFATTLLTLLLVTTPVVAQTSVAELAAYEGADRMKTHRRRETGRHADHLHVRARR